MKKVLNRFAAISLALMLMFTMGINVFAAENVDGTPSDDPAVTLDEDGAATPEEGDAAVTDAAPADEAVVQEDALEVTAKGGEITAKSENIELSITNNTGMFKAVTAYLTSESSQEYLVMALSGEGYHELFRGTYEQAVVNGDGTVDKGNDSWIHGYTNSDGKWEFKIPLNADETYVPIVAISDSYYQKSLTGQNSLARAFYPRQFTLDRDAKTLVTGDYEYTQELTVENHISMFEDPAAVINTVGGPNSNGYKSELVLTMQNDSYNKMFVGTYQEASEAATTIDLAEDKTFTVPVRWVETFGQPETMKTLIGEPFKAAFFSKENSNWLQREIIINEEEGTIIFNDVKADYSAVDAALKEVPEDLSVYTEETATAVTEAKNAVVRDMNAAAQADVDKMAEDIEKAVKALRVEKFKYEGTTVKFIKYSGEAFGMWTALEGSTFTYSDGQIHISIIPSNSKKTYSWIHWGGINEELTKDVALASDGKIVLDLSTEYCGWAVPVAPIKTKDDKATTSTQYYLAVPALTYFTTDADYTAVDAALATVPADLSIYTQETAAAVNEAVNAVAKDKKAVEQADVDRMANAIDQAVKGLKIDCSDATVDAIPAQTYKGTALTPVPTVKLGDKTLDKNTDYTVTYVNNTNAGKATVKIQGNGNYGGEVTANFTINKANNTLSVSGKTVKIKKKAVKKKAQKLAATKVMTVSNAKGTVTYKGVGVNKKSKKALKINASNGQVTVKKKTKKGTYKMNVTVTAAGNGNYKAASVTRTITVKVK